jgi:hypothetical protein
MKQGVKYNVTIFMTQAANHKLPTDGSVTRPTLLQVWCIRCIILSMEWKET